MLLRWWLQLMQGASEWENECALRVNRRRLDPIGVVPHNSVLPTKGEKKVAPVLDVEQINGSREQFVACDSVDQGSL